MQRQRPSDRAVSPFFVGAVAPRIFVQIFLRQLDLRTLAVEIVAVVPRIVRAYENSAAVTAHVAPRVRVILPLFPFLCDKRSSLHIIISCGKIRIDNSYSPQERSSPIWGGLFSYVYENRAAIAHILDGAAVDRGHRVDFTVAVTQLDEREAGDRVRLAVLECVKHICRGSKRVWN